MSTTTYQIVNPATGAQSSVVPTLGDDELDAAIQAAVEAQSAWAATPLTQRVDAAHGTAAALRSHREELAAAMTEEMGKTITESRAEVDICADIFAYYATHAFELLADEPITIVEPGRMFVRKAPVGVVLGVMPWNYPAYQIARFAAPAMLCGNAVLVKPASQCPNSSRLLGRIIEEGGHPAHVHSTIMAGRDQIAGVIADRRIAAVSFTGSAEAGAVIAQQAGENLKKCVLELGGSDPFVVLDDADLDAAMEGAIAGRFENCGQSCNAAKRFIVSEQVHDVFLEKLVAVVRELVPADPTLDDTRIGPMSSDKALRTIAGQVDDAVAAGATAVVGGHVIDREGYWYEPTVLTGVTPDMRAYEEELFGPVAVVHRASSDEEALRLANDTIFGLGAAVFGSDPARLERFVNGIDSGMVNVNLPGGSEADQPFGGTKASGWGRELGPEGMTQFVNRKAVLEGRS